MKKSIAWRARDVVQRRDRWLPHVHQLSARGIPANVRESAYLPWRLATAQSLGAEYEVPLPPTQHQSCSPVFPDLH